MSRYRRVRQPGGSFFLTLVTHRRIPLFNDPTNISRLRRAFALVRRDQRFDLHSIVVLPDHLHMVMCLPSNDTDYSSRIGKIKVAFTKSLPLELRDRLPTTDSRIRHRESSVWQRRFWEHTIRDRVDMARHVEYIHYNPVKHGLVRCPHEWKAGSFVRWAARGLVDAHWGCQCQCSFIAPEYIDSIGAVCGE